MTKIKRGMVFGVFDGLHPGHQYFLSEAAKNCSELFVVVTPSEISEFLKSKRPKQAFADRAEAIKKYSPQYTVISGDTELGSWKVLAENSPDMVFLGYDQQGIAKELDRLKAAYTFIGSFKPEIYKSSLIG